MYRHVLERMVMAHFNNKLIAYVNTGIDPSMAGQTRSATQLTTQGFAGHSTQPVALGVGRCNAGALS